MRISPESVIKILKTERVTIVSIVIGFIIFTAITVSMPAYILIALHKFDVSPMPYDFLIYMVSACISIVIVYSIAAVFDYIKKR